MSLTVAGITYVHTVNYFDKGLDENGPFYNVEYVIDDFDDSDDFLNALRGVGTADPHRHPLSNNLSCVTATATGLGRPTTNADGLPSYSGGALIRATYRGPGGAREGSTGNVLLDDPGLVHQFDPDNPIVWCTQKLSWGVERISLPNTSMVWESDSKPAGVPVTKKVYHAKMILTLHRRPNLPSSLLRSLQGKINSVSFLGCPAETVLYEGPETDRRASTDGSLEQQITIQLLYRSVSWNKFLRPSTMQFEYLKGPDDARTYETADLRPLAAI